MSLVARVASDVLDNQPDEHGLEQLTEFISSVYFRNHAFIEVDLSNRSDSTESCWLTWDQLDASPAWDYFPLCMSLVARVSSDLCDNANDEDAKGQALTELTEFISSVYYRNHAFVDCDDYVMHAFRIPKPKNSDSYDAQ